MSEPKDGVALQVIRTSIGSSFAIVLLALLCGAKAEPTASTPAPAAQASVKNIPPSKDKMWTVLRKTQIDMDFKKDVYVAKHPAEVQALVGKKISIQGFVMPVKAEIEFRHFLLVPFAPGCPFCPPAGFNEIVEVTIDRPIRAEERMFVVTGTFATQENGKDGLFFRLDNATAE